jgi:uncharacterized protein YcfJ
MPLAPASKAFVMKKVLLAAFAVILSLPAQAQLFNPSSLTGAALGGIAGAVIGHNSGRRTAEGAAIGAGAGLVLGALVHNERQERAYYSDSYYAPPPTAYYSRPNYAITGTVLGAGAGAVIGHNSGRRTAEGAAIGAGAGLILGSLAEQDARRREAYYYHPRPPVYHVTRTYVAPAPVVRVVHAAPVIVTHAPVVAPAPQAPPAPQVTIINNHYHGAGRPMNGANQLFGR